MRAFLAFELEEPVKEYLDRLVSRVSQLYEGVRWVKKENHHVTLKFFEEIEERMAEAMRETLLPLAALFAPFEVTTGGIDFFPRRARARVVVVSFKDGVERMEEIFHEVERRLSKLKLEREMRPYKPHITLGRKRNPSPVEDCPKELFHEMTFTLEKITLFKSVLSPNGPLYTPLWHIRLGTKNT